MRFSFIMLLAAVITSIILFGTEAKADNLDNFIERIEKATARNYNGVASWYGPRFHGRRTANGERFNMYALTAAHKTLPMNCYVRVTNKENGKSVIVRINDRGPFHGNRSLDLSKAAAETLGIVKTGVGKVEYKVISLSK